MVGFNRRFAPQVQKMKSLLASLKEPKAMVMTVNAGMIRPIIGPRTRKSEGGGSLGRPVILSISSDILPGKRCREVVPCLMGKEGPQDTLSFTLKFAGGSIGTIHYFCQRQ